MIPEPSEHQCSCSQKISFLIGKEREKFWEEETRRSLLLCILERKEEIYIGTNPLM